jgi:hypothetical protein
MTIHSPAGNPGLSGLNPLSGDLSFTFSPPTPGGPIGTEPGLWLAGDASSGHAANLIGGDPNSPNSHDQGAELQYLIGQQHNPSGITLPATPSGSLSGVTFSLPPVSAPPTGTPPVPFTEDFGSGLLGSAPPDLALLAETKGGSHGGGGGQGGGPPSGHGGGGGGGGTLNETYGNGALQFNVTYDSSVTGSSSAAQIESGFATAVQYFLDNFTAPIGTTNPVILNLDVGYGEVLGNHLPRFALGESDTYLQQVNYGDFQPVMSQGGNVSSLPSKDPISGTHAYWMATAEAKAVGLTPNSTALDGGVGFGSNVSWDFNQETPPSGSYDFVGVAQHEISETMGRIALLGTSVGGVANSYSPFDLFRFDATNSRSLSGGQAAQYSFNDGQTLGDSFNTVSGADYGDWTSSSAPPIGSTPDAYNAYGYPGYEYLPSTGDGTVVAGLGYGSVLGSYAVT